jgi:hypothetical protein
MPVGVHHEDRARSMAFCGGDQHPNANAMRRVVHDVVHKRDGIARAGVSDSRLAVVGLHDRHLGHPAWTCRLLEYARTP